MFQCSSASRKFLNRHPARRPANGESFSALQRAENSSIVPEQRRAVSLSGFSALQRAENSSMRAGARRPQRSRRVSVLFSEPKIPQ